LIRRNEKMDELCEGFFDEYSTDFYEYFDKHLVRNVIKKGDYKKIEDEIKEIKNKNPNMVTLLEEREDVDLTYEDEKALNEILSLERELNIIELKESFKLGFKEAYIYFESMGMLNI
jgi:hypothetical protein